jgi:hypothetical protein
VGTSRGLVAVEGRKAPWGPHVEPSPNGEAWHRCDVGNRPLGPYAPKPSKAGREARPGTSTLLRVSPSETLSTGLVEAEVVQDPQDVVVEEALEVLAADIERRHRGQDDGPQVGEPS